MVNHTPACVKRGIATINKLRVHEATKEMYADCTSNDYTVYQKWLEDFQRMASNPILMEECSIGGDQYELDFEYRISAKVVELATQYLKDRYWNHIEFKQFRLEKLVLTIGE